MKQYEVTTADGKTTTVAADAYVVGHSISGSAYNDLIFRDDSSNELARFAQGEWRRVLKITEDPQGEQPHE